MNGSFLMTNALQDDPVFIYLSAKYSEVLRESIVGKRSTVQLRRSLVLWKSENLESESALIEAAETIT